MAASALRSDEFALGWGVRATSHMLILVQEPYVVRCLLRISRAPRRLAAHSS
jgi:hypothetical protein